MSGEDDGDRFRGGGLNPLNYPHRLAQYRKQDPDEPGAREAHDPHKWEDPDPSWRERLTPNTTAGWLAAAVAFFIVGGLLLYLVPIFAPTFRNPLVPIVATVVGALILFALWNQHRGFQRAVRAPKSIIHYGDDAEIRFVEDQGTDGRSQLVTPYVDCSYGGFNFRPLKKRDLPFDPSRLRSNIGRKDDVGEEEVVDRLNGTTVEVNTETFGTIFVTHADGMEYDGFGRHSDRYTTLPNTIDEDVAREMQTLIESLETSIQTLRQQVTMLEERGDQLRDTRRGMFVDELSGAMNLLEKLNKMAQRPSHRQRRRDADEPALSANGHAEDPVAAIEEEVEEEMEETYS